MFFGVWKVLLASILLQISSLRTWKKIFGSLGNNLPGKYVGEDIHPGPRDNCATQVFNNKMLVFGGDGNDMYGERGVLNDFWEFDPMTKEWKFFFGSTSKDGAESCQTSNCETFSTGNVPRAVQGSSLDKCNSEGSKFCMFGGAPTWSDSYYSDMWFFEFQSDGTLVTMKSRPGINPDGEYVGSVQYPRPRSFYCSWTQDSNPTTIYYFGGVEDGIGYFNDMWIYSANFDSWSRVEYPGTTNSSFFISVNGNYPSKGTFGSNYFPGGRNCRTHWQFDELLYVFGGFIQGVSVNGYYSDLWAFDTTANTWGFILGEDFNIKSRSVGEGYFTEYSSVNFPPSFGNSKGSKLRDEIYFVIGLLQGPIAFGMKYPWVFSGELKQYKFMNETTIYRQSVKEVVIENKIYIFGGYAGPSDGNQRGNEVWVYGEEVLPTSPWDFLGFFLELYFLIPSGTMLGVVFFILIILIILFFSLIFCCNNNRKRLKRKRVRRLLRNLRNNMTESVENNVSLIDENDVKSCSDNLELFISHVEKAIPIENDILILGKTILKDMKNLVLNNVNVNAFIMSLSNCIINEEGTFGGLKPKSCCVSLHVLLLCCEVFWITNGIGENSQKFGISRQGIIKMVEKVQKTMNNSQRVKYELCCLLEFSKLCEIDIRSNIENQINTERNLTGVLTVFYKNIKILWENISINDYQLLVHYRLKSYFINNENLDSIFSSFVENSPNVTRCGCFCKRSNKLNEIELEELEDYSEYIDMECCIKESQYKNTSDFFLTGLVLILNNVMMFNDDLNLKSKKNVFTTIINVLLSIKKMKVVLFLLKELNNDKLKEEEMKGNLKYMKKMIAKIFVDGKISSYMVEFS